MESAEREAFGAVVVWAASQGKRVWWQLHMKPADTRESRSNCLEYITRVCVLFQCMCVCIDPAALDVVRQVSFHLDGSLDSCSCQLLPVSRAGWTLEISEIVHTVRHGYL